MRSPFQVLIILFRRNVGDIEYAVFKRHDTGWWQFVAGGGEDNETPLQAAERETAEETGIVASGRLIKLDSMATVPKDCFAAADSWGAAVYVIPEYGFAIEADEADIEISREHTEFRWVGYNEAYAMLRWDSNRNALWELDQRLKNRLP